MISVSPWIHHWKNVRILRWPLFRAWATPASRIWCRSRRRARCLRPGVGKTAGGRSRSRILCCSMQRGRTCSRWRRPKVTAAELCSWRGWRRIAAAWWAVSPASCWFSSAAGFVNDRRRIAVVINLTKQIKACFLFGALICFWFLLIKINFFSLYFNFLISVLNFFIIRFIVVHITVFGSGFYVSFLFWLWVISKYIWMLWD